MRKQHNMLAGMIIRHHARRISPACFHCDASQYFMCSHDVLCVATLAMGRLSPYQMYMRRLSPYVCVGDHSPLSCCGDIRHHARRIAPAYFHCNASQYFMLFPHAFLCLIKSNVYEATLAICVLATIRHCLVSATFAIMHWFANLV